MIPDRRVTVCRGPEANVVIEAALAGATRRVVTGDEDLLNFGTYETVSFVTPRTFLDRLDEEVSGTDADEEPSNAS